MTGIIKVESVDYRLCIGGLEIVYRGYKYRKAGNDLFKTKGNNKEISTMVESHNLGLVEFKKSC